MKKAVLKNFVIFKGTPLKKFRNTYFEEHLRTAASEREALMY